MKNNNNKFNKNVNSVDINDNKNNGDGLMKLKNIAIVDKKDWKKLSKSKAYGYYAEIALKAAEADELIGEARTILLKNHEDILKFQEDVLKAGKVNKELGKVNKEQAKVIEEQGKVNKEQAKVNKEQEKRIEEQAKVNKEQKKRIEEQEKRIEEQAKVIEEQGKVNKEFTDKSEDLEIVNVKGIGKVDAATEINNEIQGKLDIIAESITADYEVYDDCTDELCVKAGMISNFRENIKQNKKSIAIAKHDIKMGVAVNRNEKWIRDLEGQNRYLQNQINGFQATFDEFKTKKTDVSKIIDTKRSNYKELQNAWALVNGVLNE